MIKIFDENYWQVGDNVYSMKVMKFGTIVRISLDPDKLKVQYKDKSCDSYYENGNFLEGSNRTLFHKEAITFDSQSRPIAINYDYIPKREPKYIFKPFDKVLVRDKDTYKWQIELFQNIDGDKFVCLRSWWEQCIPYEGNEHLLGTNNHQN